MGEDEAGVTPGSRVADGAGPAQLVIEEAANAVGGDVGLDDFSREGHAVAGGGDARTEFVIVGEVIDQGSEAADFFESFAAESQRGAEAVVQAAFYPF